VVNQLKQEDGTYNIGKRLHDLRNLMGLTQAEVAAGTGTATEKPMDAGVISRYENGTTIPGWRAIERILAAMGQIPCGLFSDVCKANDRCPADDTFRMDYYARPPMSPGDLRPTEVLTVPKHAPLMRILQMVPADDRYVITRAVSDMMIPFWNPGDMVVVDRTLEPKIGRVIVGFYEDEPLAGRLIKHNKNLFIAFSNLHYSPMPYNKRQWAHHGTVIYAFRDLLTRFVGMERRMT
jgi:transcriptional regulator with XRE-family HTH domain